jgi:hypothetical protein
MNTAKELPLDSQQVRLKSHEIQNPMKFIQDTFKSSICFACFPEMEERYYSRSVLQHDCAIFPSRHLHWSLFDLSLPAAGSD